MIDFGSKNTLWIFISTPRSIQFSVNRRLIIIHGTYGLYGDEFTAPEASCKTIFQGAYGGLTFVTERFTVRKVSQMVLVLICLYWFNWLQNIWYCHTIDSVNLFPNIDVDPNIVKISNLLCQMQRTSQEVFDIDQQHQKSSAFLMRCNWKMQPHTTPRKHKILGKWTFTPTFTVL